MKKIYTSEGFSSGWRKLALAALLASGFTAAQAQDASVVVLHTLGKLATPSSLPHSVVAAVRNTGTTALTNQTVTLAVTGANTFNNTKTIASLAVGATAVVTFDPYPTTLALGTNTLTVSVPADANNTNNTQTYTQQVTTNLVTQPDPTQGWNATGVGVSNTTAGGALATKFTTSQPITLNEAKLTFINAGTAGTLYQVQIFDATGASGTPGTAIYTSPTQTRPTIAATGQTAVATVSLPAVAVTGSYYLGVREVGTASGAGANVGLAYQVEDPLRANTSYYQVAAGGAWTDVGTTTLRTRLALEVGVGGTITCAYPTALAASSVTTTSASIAFTAPSNGASYSLIYGPYGFSPSTAGTTVAATASPVNLTGLTPNTRYQVYVRANCGTTAGLSALSEPVTFTTLPTCPAPTAITVSNITGTGATVTFTAPSNGTGYTYWVVPRGATPPTTGGTTATASPITLSGLNSNTNYDLYIRANCGSTDQSPLAGPVAFTTACVPGIVSTYPYSEYFDNVAANTLPCGVTTLNANNDTGIWSVQAANPATAPNAMRYNYSAANAANDWFFTPALLFRVGYRYQLTFKYRAQSATFPEGLEVKYGSAATAAGQTTTLFTNTAITNITYTTTTAGSAAGQVLSITPTANGTGYIGFHAISAADQFNLFVDDVVVTETLVTATQSAELSKALSVYPNPSNGQFTLDVAGTASKAATLQLQVSNALGQIVHEGSVKNAASNKLDLSKLKAGIYNLRLQDGDQFTVRRIVIE